jgi:hypothetical protein
MEEKIERLFQIHEENEEWFNANFEEIRQKYGSKFFAIKDQDILIAEDKMETLLDLLEEKNININEVFITSIPPKGLASIL